MSLYSLIFLLLTSLLLTLPCIIGRDASEMTQSGTKCPLNLGHFQCSCSNHSYRSGVQILCEHSELVHVISSLNDFDQEIAMLSIRNCKTEITAFPSLPRIKLRGLEISKCQIGTIGARTFNNVSGTLEELSLVEDKLEAMPPVSLLQNLILLNLNRNNIDNVGEQVFNGLKKLKYLRLKSNNLTSFPPGTLNHIKDSLELLDLSDNSITLVPAQMLRNSPSLAFLSLSNNKIAQLTTMQFMNLPNLLELRLHGNQIIRIQPSAFMNVPKLRHLFLQGNNLSAIDPGTFQNFKNLELLDISSNQLMKIPPIKDLPKLTEIRLQNNMIRGIDTLAFTLNPQLRYIFLENNRVSSIARNSFDTLDSLESLILTNNSLDFLDRSMFDGMRNLNHLSLRNNSISTLGNYTFASVPELTVLDLSYNKLSNIFPMTFTRLKKLNFLILSENSIETIEENSFQSPVATILLDGNPLKCDETMDWFINYVVSNRVQTFVQGQPDVVCKAPEAKKGKRLKDIMLSRMSMSPREPLIPPAIQRGALDNKMTSNLLNQFLPGLMRNSNQKDTLAALGTLTQSFPAIRDIPGINMLSPAQTNQFGARSSSDPIDQFAEPLIKFASGATPQMSDVNKLLSSLPNLVVRVPNFGDVDVSKLSPALVEHVLRGGQIPGVPRETLDFIVKQYMERMYTAAATHQGILTSTEFPIPKNFNESYYLRPLTELPKSLIKNVLEGQPLPHLSDEKTSVIKDYYTQQLPIPEGGNETVNISQLIPPRLLTMVKLLPPNYPIGKLPPELLQDAMENRFPNLTLLPEDLQVYLKNNLDRLSKADGNEDLPIHEIIHYLPVFDKPELTTFAPYDINNVDSELVIQDQEKVNSMRLYTAIMLGLVAACTLSVLTGFCVYLRHNRSASLALNSDMIPVANNSLAAIVREQSFRPSASSTLRSTLRSTMNT